MSPLSCSCSPAFRSPHCRCIPHSSGNPRHCKPRRREEGSKTGPFSDFVSHFQEHKLPWLPKPGLFISNVCSRCQIHEVPSAGGCCGRSSACHHHFNLLSSCRDPAPPWEGDHGTRGSGCFPEPVRLSFPQTPIICTGIM